MTEKPVFALMYDFDKTLSPRDMQEYGFIPGIGLDPGEFWARCDDVMKKNGMDQILAYMYVMCRDSHGKMLFTRNTLRDLGKDVELFKGVDSWFGRVNSYAEEHGMKAEHYIISSGLGVIIEGTPIAHEFERIYAADFLYDDDGVPCWPAMAVNYSSKTQFIYRINKGILDITDNEGVNEFMPDELRRVPFRNMVYIGDGMTDVPCMKIVRSNGGHSIAVYQGECGVVSDLVLHGRADFALKADYSAGSEMENAVFALISKAEADNRAVGLHVQSLQKARRETDEKMENLWKQKNCPG